MTMAAESTTRDIKMMPSADNSHERCTACGGQNHGCVFRAVSACLRDWLLGKEF